MPLREDLLRPAPVRGGAQLLVRFQARGQKAAGARESARGGAEAAQDLESVLLLLLLLYISELSV